MDPRNISGIKDIDPDLMNLINTSGDDDKKMYEFLSLRLTLLNKFYPEQGDHHRQEILKTWDLYHAIKHLQYMKANAIAELTMLLHFDDKKFREMMGKPAGRLSIPKIGDSSTAKNAKRVKTEKNPDGDSNGNNSDRLSMNMMKSAFELICTQKSPNKNKNSEDEEDFVDRSFTISNPHSLMLSNDRRFLTIIYNTTVYLSPGDVDANYIRFSIKIGENEPWAYKYNDLVFTLNDKDFQGRSGNTRPVITQNYSDPPFVVSLHMKPVQKTEKVKVKIPTQELNMEEIQKELDRRSMH